MRMGKRRCKIIKWDCVRVSDWQSTERMVRSLMCLLGFMVMKFIQEQPAWSFGKIQPDASLCMQPWLERKFGFPRELDEVSIVSGWKEVVGRNRPQIWSWVRNAEARRRVDHRKQVVDEWVEVPVRLKTVGVPGIHWSELRIWDLSQRLRCLRWSLDSGLWESKILNKFPKTTLLLF